MLSVRTYLVIVLAIGALISAVFLVLEPLTDFAFLWLEWPGITAAYFLWGAVGGPTFLGIAICWVVNALTYGLAAFVILSAFKVLREA
ncbi:apolipoprotein N-acyltransferase [Bradyrhizobium sp. USDA 4354]